MKKNCIACLFLCAPHIHKWCFSRKIIACRNVFAYMNFTSLGCDGDGSTIQTHINCFIYVQYLTRDFWSCLNCSVFFESIHDAYVFDEMRKGEKLNNKKNDKLIVKEFHSASLLLPLILKF